MGIFWGRLRIASVFVFSTAMAVVGTGCISNPSMSVSSLDSSSSTASEVSSSSSSSSYPPFRLSAASSSIVAGATTTLEVVRQNSVGDIVTGYTGTITFTSSDAQAVLPGNYTYAVGDLGSQSFVVDLRSAGSNTVVVTDMSSAALTATIVISVSAAGATKFKIVGSPLFPTITQNYCLPISVQSTDSYGNVVAGTIQNIANFSTAGSYLSITSSCTAPSAGQSTDIATGSYQSTGTIYFGNATVASHGITVGGSLASDTATISVVPSLSFTSSFIDMMIGTAQNFASLRTGGVSSFTFYLDSGLGSLDVATYTAPLTTDIATIRVTDYLGNYAYSQAHVSFPEKLALSNLSSCFLASNGKVKCWGENYDGQLGIGVSGAGTNRGDAGGEMGVNLPWVGFAGRKATDISANANADHTCALLVDGTVSCWGMNFAGVLGTGNTVSSSTPVDIDLASTAVAIAGGGDHTCAILSSGAVKCWGANNFGQLGLGDISSRGDNPGDMGTNLPIVSLGTGRTAKSLAGGLDHTCAILDNDNVKCWGNGSFGQLGSENTLNVGDTSSEMGDSLPYVNLGTGRTAKAIAAGTYHTCAILDNDSMKCWGRNGAGQLGQQHSSDIGDSASEMGDFLPAIDFNGLTVKQISLGGFFTCAVLSDNAVRCWGQGGDQLGLEHTNYVGDGINEMGSFLPSVNIGTSKLVNASSKTLSTGYGHTCVIMDDKYVKCWGSNGSGQLGAGNTTTKGSTVGDMGDSLSTVSLY